MQADGTEEIEAIAVADVLTRGGMKVTLASVGRKLQNIVTMSQGTKVQGDIAIEACVDLSFDLIMCPGVSAGVLSSRSAGATDTTVIFERYYPGTWRAAPARLARAHNDASEAEEPRSILWRHLRGTRGCAPPHELLDDGPATTYPSYESKMTGVDLRTEERVVVNGKCVTSQGPGTAIEMGLKLVELLCSEEKAKSVAQALVV